MSEVLAIIPWCGGSKGIPRKNVQPFLGEPLLARTVDHARQAPSVTRVVVSTDDAEIASVARQYGAEVVIRPADLSGDVASSESALRHVLDHLASAEGYEPDLVVFLQTTSPLAGPGMSRQRSICSVASRRTRCSRGHRSMASSGACTTTA